MTGPVVKVTVQIGEQSMEIVCSETALDAVRWNFNPSGQANVHLLKAVSAGLITACEDLKGNSGQPARWAQIAITNIETAQMFAVKSATYS